ncbi:MAG: hypothetical protein HKN68_13480 [Saprospiraceae bacterium]|nr:hypothetical protein [Saprospiraceae bacterium]
MRTTDFSKAISKQAFTSLRSFLNSQNSNKGYNMKFPMLDDKGEIEGYCIQKYDQWCHIIEETYFSEKSQFLLKVMITNDVNGIPLRKDYFNGKGQRLEVESLYQQAS